MRPIDPSLRIGAVRAGRHRTCRASADFYSRVLGLPLLERDGERALLGAGPASRRSS